MTHLTAGVCNSVVDLSDAALDMEPFANALTLRAGRLRTASTMPAATAFDLERTLKITG